MAGGLNETYGPMGPDVIASYDFIDIASGTGLFNFYAGATVDKYILSNILFWSDTVGTAEYTGTQSSWTEVFDIDFDVLINKPITIKGNTVVNIPLKIGLSGSTAGASASFKVNVLVRKWDGSTETEIVSNYTKDGYTSLNLTAYDVSAVDLNIPSTKFKKGDYLRLTCVGYAKRTQDGTYNVQMGHDPKNRSVDWDASGSPSQLLFQVPIELDL